MRRDSILVWVDMLSFTMRWIGISARLLEVSEPRSYGLGGRAIDRQFGCQTFESYWSLLGRLIRSLINFKYWMVVELQSTAAPVFSFIESFIGVNQIDLMAGHRRSFTILRNIGKQTLDNFKIGNSPQFRSEKCCCYQKRGLP